MTMQVSQDFAPPFKLIVPYFIIGVFSFLFCTLYLFQININELHFLNPNILSLVHMFLLSFVMMIIFGAMAQLIPVTLEVGHYCLKLYYIIYPLLSFGTVLMVFGFSFHFLLPYGGLFVLLAMSLFIFEFFATIKKVKKFDNIVKSLVIAHIFLFLGLLIGITLALSYAGLINIDMFSFLKAHVYLLLLGYVCILIMALALVLMPMFSLSHDFSKTPTNFAVSSLSIAVLVLVFASLFHFEYLSVFAYVLSIVALLSFFYQCYILYKTRVKKHIDIYVKFLFVSFYSLLVSIVLFIIYFYQNKEQYLLSAGFLLFFGFFAFLIIAHIYKIVPFLVWFDKFAPLVGKEKVPMLKDIIPQKSAHFQFYFALIGLNISALALILSSSSLFKIGASFLVIASLYFCANLIYMIRFSHVHKR